jgi:hypothetical protein
MAKAGNTAGVFKGAHRGAFGKVGIGRKVTHFNSKMPGGNGKTKQGRVVVRSNARAHGNNGFGVVTGGLNPNTPGRHPTPGHGGLGV